jgi:hypothetical protein
MMLNVCNQLRTFQLIRGWVSPDIKLSVININSRRRLSTFNEENSFAINLNQALIDKWVKLLTDSRLQQIFEMKQELVFVLVKHIDFMPDSDDFAVVLHPNDKQPPIRI